MSERPFVPTPEALLAQRAWIRAIARSLVGDENAVDDVEQRTWMTVMRNRRPVESIRGWLRRVVRSAAADERRGAARRHARESRAARAEAQPSTEHLVVEAEAQRSVAAAVVALPEPYRSTVLLRYFEGLTPTEIAERTGDPVDTVKTRLKRGLTMLRVALDRDFGDRRAWAFVLAPLARVRIPVAGGVAAGVAGGVAMGLKAKVVACAVAVVALVGAGFVWTATDGPDVASTPETPPVTGPATPAPRAAATTPLVAITGRVRSRRDGGPVAAAHVAASGPRGASSPQIDTSPDGTFRLDGAAPGPVRVTAPRFAAATVELAATATGETHADVGDVWLDAAASLVVEVLGPADAPVAGADVRLVHRQDAGAVATTHSYLTAVADPDAGRTDVDRKATLTDGTARFDGIAAGGHELVVRAQGFAARFVGCLDVAPGRDETRTTVRLVPAHRITGRVVTASGEPAPGRVVDAGAAGWDESAFARTDDEGRFALDDVPAGDVSLRVGRVRGWNPQIATVRVPDVSHVELRLPPMGAVAGTVSLADGTPVAGAVVGVETNWGWNRSADALAVSDAQGRYRVEEIPAGRIDRFSVRRLGLFHVGPRLELSELRDRRGGADAGLSTLVVAGTDLRLDATMAKGARLHGRVTGPGGAVGGAWVYLHLKPTRAGQEWETAVCDAAGRYAFDFLPPGPAAAVPLHPAYVHPDGPAELGTALGKGEVAPSLTFELPDGGDVERNFTMVAGTRVAGRVVGPTGAPVAGAVVRCDETRYSGPPMTATTTDADGAFVLERVAGPGKTKLRVVAAGLVQENVPDVTLAPAGRADGIDVRMVNPPVVRGRVLDPDGAPVPGAAVTMRLAVWDGAAADPAVAVTDAAGAWSAPLPRAAGKVVVAASASGWEPADVTAEVGAAGADVDVRLVRGAVVAGRVTDAAGAPVGGAAIVALDGTKRIAWYYGDLLSSSGDAEVVRASTDAEGRFRVALRAGPWTLVVRAHGQVDATVPTTAPSGDDVAVRMQPATTLSGSLRAEDGAPLVGTVVLLQPGADVSSERLSIFGSFSPDVLDLGDHLLSHRTGASGAFAFPGVPEGTYTLVAVFPAATSQRFREVRFGPLRPSGSPHDLTLAAPVASALAGRVVDAAGAPYADAWVQITIVPETGPSSAPAWAPRRTQTVDAAADGTFRLEGLTAASYTLQANVHTGRGEATYQGRTVPTWKSMTRRAFHGLRPPRADLVLEMTEGVRSSGRLLDETGAPLGGSVVTAEAPDGDPAVLSVTVTTRGDGTFTFAGLEAVAYRIVLGTGRGVATPGVPRRRAVMPRPFRGGDEVGDVTATLEARIRGCVTDKAGAPVAGAVVEWFPENGGVSDRVTAGADGSFEVTGLEPGVRIRLGVQRADGTSSWAGKSLDKVPAHAPGETDVRLVRE